MTFFTLIFTLLRSSLPLDPPLIDHLESTLLEEIFKFKTHIESVNQND